MEKFPFYTAITHLRDFHGISMNPDEFESLAWHGWNHIGNKETKLYRYNAHIENGQVALPCNVDIIESVNSTTEDFYKPENVTREDYSNLTLESYIEGRKSHKDPLYQRGRQLKLYKGILVDEEGLPSLNFKEVEALSNYCAFIHLRKMGMITKDSNLIQMSQLVQNEWKRSCDDARTPITLSQNFFNDLTDVQGSWDRKRFGKSLKVLK
jgi:hypothetical protein